MRLDSPSSRPTARLIYPGQDHVVRSGADATVTGWGGLTSEQENPRTPVDLQVGSLSLPSATDCFARLADYGGMNLRPDDSQVCAGPGALHQPEQVHACQVDRGGTLRLED